MATYVRGFVVTDVAVVHELFLKVMADAERLESIGRKTGVKIETRATLAQLRRVYSDFNAGLRANAVKAADLASAGMIDRLKSTQVRGDTGSAPHLADLLHARALSPYAGFETGAVGVADVRLLDRAINPHSRYGTYWRAQEYGTGREGVPTQVGRVLRGYFTDAGGGNQSAPDAQFAGGGGGPHPVFLSGSSGGQRLTGSGRGPGPRGGVGGWGTIGVEDKPRHFIGYGADEASIEWRAGIARVQSQAIDGLRAILL